MASGPSSDCIGLRGNVPRPLSVLGWWNHPHHIRLSVEKTNLTTDNNYRDINLKVDGTKVRGLRCCLGACLFWSHTWWCLESPSSSELLGHSGDGTWAFCLRSPYCSPLSPSPAPGFYSERRTEMGVLEVQGEWRGALMRKE